VDHEFSESQALLKRTAADYFSREFPLDRIRDFRDDRPKAERDLWEGIQSLGWSAAPFPEAVGGFPGTFMDAAVILEEMGKAAAPSPYLHSTIAAGLAFSSAGHPLAAEIATGSAVVIPAPLADSFPAPEADGSKVTGTLYGVPWLELATHFIVPLPRGRGALISAGSEGVSRERLDSSGIESLGILRLAFTPATEDLAASVLHDAGIAGAAGASLVLMGASQCALDLAVSYMKERIQFGKPIGTFQALQHRAADMSIAIDVGRNLAYKAASLHGSPEFERSARYAKAWASDAAKQVTRDAIQMHGGVGFTDDHRVQLPYRLAMNLANNYGTAHEHRAAITELVLAGQRA
jgi:alkylation response protein AidB-like acyl-CoA dehydrogenase